MSRRKQAKSPFSVTVLLGLVLTFTALQAVRLWAALTNWEFLSSLPLSVPPAYLAASGLLWALGGAWLAVGLWTAKPWAPRGTRIGLAAYTAFHWLDKSFLQVGGLQSSNLAFEAGLSLILIGSVLAVLALPQVQAYFGSTAIGAKR